MAIFGMFKNLLLGQQSNNQSTNHKLPSIILKDVNPMDYWKVLGEIAEGAFGKIEKVCSLSNSHLIAASKAISPQEGENLEDFLVEIEILSLAKDHENIVGLHACYFFEEKLYMILEYCAGGAIDSIMAELDKPLTEPQIAYVTHGVVKALEFLHSQAVIHRDLKAGNILLSADGIVKLADFGVSAIMKNHQKRDSFIGTPYWMAPEVIICETFKDQPYDSRADIWSLGITLIEMAQIEPPNHNMNPMRVVIKIQKSEPPTLAHPQRWTSTFSEFLRKCLVKNPDERWNAQQLLNHSFIRTATDRRPIIKLLCEKNADVLEEIIEVVGANNIEIDSIADSEERETCSDIDSISTINNANNNPLRTSIENIPNFRHAPFEPTTSAVVIDPNKDNNNKNNEQQQQFVIVSKKNYEAPQPPPEPPALLPWGTTPDDDAINARSHSTLSPSGQEAIQILDDLCDVLDNDGDEDVVSSNTASFQSEPVILGEHSMPSLLHSSSVDDRKTVVHLSNEQINAEPTTIHLSCDDLPPPEPPVDYDVEDNIIREKLQKEISKVTPERIAKTEDKRKRSGSVNAENISTATNGGGYLNQRHSHPVADNLLQKQNVRSSPPLPAAKEQGIVHPSVPSTTSNLIEKSNQIHRPQQHKERQPSVHVPMRKSPHRATVTKRTRTYVVDGVEVTSTTMHVLGEKQDLELRKKELRDLKRIQREEARQQQELNARAEQIREQQERKFAFEMQAIQKSYESEVEAISKAQKKKMEEQEKQQEEEMRNLAKRIRIDQERDLRLFRDRLRQQEKILKQEVGMLPKSQRKPVMKQRQESFEKYQMDKEAEFLNQLERNKENFLQKAQDRHRERLCLLERQFLEQKHQLERGLETAQWELEEAQLAEKHALLTQQFRDVFHLQRTHMLARHAKEGEHVRRINQANEENMLRALTIDRKALPKVLRNESKTRTMMFRKSLEVDLPGESSETWTAKIKIFEEKEKQRIRLKMDEYDLKCKRKLAQLVENNQNVLRELEEIHNEKRNMLLDNERAKLAEYEKEYQQVLSEWKSNLSSRKAALEAKFSEELATQELRK
uniref:Protein kinase domain-containing protein n=1 Tax=Meloidogyne incognita TaxID=6306 RepID=A0A914KRE7_MELIC